MSDEEEGTQRHPRATGDIIRANPPEGCFVMDSRPAPSKLLKFGLFELDLEAQQLRKGGVPQRLQPQPFKVLCVLAGSRGRVVTREELRRELWGAETFVDFEQGLNYCIRQIRTVLGDEAQSPHFIETVPRRGYRFISTIEAPARSEENRSEKQSGVGREPWAQRRKFVLAAIAAVAVLTVSIAGLWFHKRPALTTRDYLLITDFSNQTGDPIFDSTLRKAVAIDLGQSPYLNIVSDDKIRQTLRLMGKPADTRVTAEVGREICRRTGIKALLTGSLEGVAQQYLLALEVINASSGEVLAEERVHAAKDQILNVIGESNERLREKLGESLSSIQQFGKPLEQATTPSLEALQLFTLGSEKRGEGDLPAIPYFQRAIQIDPDFALAHANLGAAYLNLEQLQLAEEHEKRAMALADRVSERERLYITAHYYLLIGQREKVAETYETYTQLYPQDPLPRSNLANEYVVLGRFDKALEQALAGMRIAPDFVGMYGEAAEAYAALGRLDEAKQALVQGLRLTPDASWLHLQLSNVALAQGDTTVRSQEDASLRNTPGGTLSLLYRDAALAATRGRLHESEELYSQASQLAIKMGLKENASFAMGLCAVYQAYLRQPAHARKSANAALELSQMSDTVEPVAVALAAAGDDTQAQSLIDNLGKRRPEDTSIRFVYGPMVHAIVMLHHSNSEGAVRLLASGVPYDRGNLDSMLTRANAFLQAKRGVEAVDEFRRLASLRKGFPSDPAAGLALLGLARAYAMTGDANSARGCYQEFFRLWNDADPDSPILQDARAEAARL